MGGRVSGLYWLARKAKDLIVPRVMFTEGPAWDVGASGCYYRPFFGEMEELATGRLISLESGLLVVSIRPWEEEARGRNWLAEILSHEWRHHWQWFNSSHAQSQYLDSALDYDKAIVKFFRQPNELDALMFSHKVAPSEVTKQWLSMIKRNA